MTVGVALCADFKLSDALFLSARTYQAAPEPFAASPPWKNPHGEACSRRM
jgi:hypothetical protein